MEADPDLQGSSPRRLLAVEALELGTHEERRADGAVGVVRVRLEEVHEANKYEHAPISGPVWGCGVRLEEVPD